MSATVAVVQTSAVGVGVAVDIVGTSAFQQVKLVGGDVGNSSPIGATTGVPAAGSTGLVVAVIPGVSVSAQVSGTVTVGGVSGTVSILGIVPVTTAASVSVSGLPVWLNPTQSLVVNTAPTVAGASVTIQQGASVSAVVSGTVTISPTTFTVNTAPTVAGASVTIQQGASVSAVVSGTVSILNVVPVTTAASVSVTGWPVWMNPTQQVVVSGLAGHSVTGTVSILNVVPVTTAASVSVTGWPVWLNPTQQVVVSGFQGQSVSAVVSGTISILNVVPVTTAASVSVTGIPVWLNPTQTVNIQSIASTVNVAIVAGAGGGGSVTTAVPSISATGQIMWVVGGQSTTASPVFVSQIGTALVSQVGGASVSAVVSGTVSILNIVPVTTQASVSVTGLPVWWNPTATVVVSGNVLATTTAVSGSTGGLVWLGASQTIIDYARTPWMMVVTSTAGASAGTTYLMTIWTGGTLSGAATTQYAVPSGKTLRIVGMQVGAVSATNVALLQVMVVMATASASFTSGSIATIGRPVQLNVGLSSAVAVTSMASMFGYMADVPAATTIAVFATVGAQVSGMNIVCNGYLF